jgi:predicted metal-dependent phosphotriesterase family hydrolase
MDRIQSEQMTGLARLVTIALMSMIKELLAAGYGDYILLSHDAGWYQPGQPNGGSQKPYTYLLGTSVPKLRNSGIDEPTVQRLIGENPKRALAFWSPAPATPMGLHVESSP